MTDYANRIAFKLIYYKCIHPEDTWFHLFSGSTIIEGNIYRTVYSMRQLGVSYKDIDSSIIAMERSGFNIADFDKRGKLLGLRRAI